MPKRKPAPIKTPALLAIFACHLIAIHALLPRFVQLTRVRGDFMLEMVLPVIFLWMAVGDQTHRLARKLMLLVAFTVPLAPYLYEFWGVLHDARPGAVQHEAFRLPG